jgi:hypothetical protein
MVRKIYCQRIVQLIMATTAAPRAVLATPAATATAANARAAPQHAAAGPFDIEKSAMLYWKRLGSVSIFQSFCVRSAREKR